MEGYLDTDYTFVLDRDTPDINSLDDIRGKAIAVNNGSAYDVWATDNADEYDLDVQRYGKNADAVQAVLTGRAAYNLAGGTVARWVALQNSRLKAGFTISTGSKFSAGFRHEDVALRNQVEFVSHPPEKIECLDEECHLLLGEEAEVQQVVQISQGGLSTPRHPISGVIVAQRPRALFHVRLKEE